VEGIEDSKPCSDNVRPPGRFDHVILRVVSYDVLLVTGHSSRCELFQKVTLRCKRWVYEGDVAAAMVELAQRVTICTEGRV